MSQQKRWVLWGSWSQNWDQQVGDSSSHELLGQACPKSFPRKWPRQKRGVLNRKMLLLLLIYSLLFRKCLNVRCLSHCTTTRRELQMTTCHYMGLRSKHDCSVHCLFCSTATPKSDKTDSYSTLHWHHPLILKKVKPTHHYLPQCARRDILPGQMYDRTEILTNEEEKVIPQTGRLGHRRLLCCCVALYGHSLCPVFSLVWCSSGSWATFSN